MGVCIVNIAFFFVANRVIDARENTNRTTWRSPQILFISNVVLHSAKFSLPTETPMSYTQIICTRLVVYKNYQHVPNLTCIQLNNKGKAEKRGVLVTNLHIFKLHPKTFKVRRKEIPLIAVQSIRYLFFPSLCVV